MANVHGFNDINNNRPGQNNGIRQPMMGNFQQDSTNVMS
jgi:hypothetical protein